jgi:hypothetical protein
MVENTGSPGVMRGESVESLSFSEHERKGIPGTSMINQQQNGLVEKT